MSTAPEASDLQRPRRRRFDRRHAPLGERGNLGTPFFDGRLGLETNPDLLDVAVRMRAYRHMRSQNPKLRQAWRLLLQTLLSGARQLVATGNTPQHEIGVKLSAEVFGLEGKLRKPADAGEGATSTVLEAPTAYVLDEAFEAVLARQLKFAPDGFRYQEVVWDLEYSRTLGRVVTLPVRIADRSPESHYKWIEWQGRLLGVLQRPMPGRPMPKPIPLDKLLYTALEGDGGNYEGIGLLRSSWFPDKAVRTVVDMLLVGLGRWAIPTGKITTDRKAAADVNMEAGQIKEAREALAKQLNSVRAQATGHVEDDEVVKVSTYGGAGTLDTRGFREVIELLDSRAVAPFLTQFLELGMTQVGARAVGEVHESVFRRSALNLLDIVADAFHRLFGQILRFNLGPGAEQYAPRLMFTGLDVGPLREMLAVVIQAVQAEILKPEDARSPFLELLAMGAR